MSDVDTEDMDGDKDEKMTIDQWQDRKTKVEMTLLWHQNNVKHAHHAILMHSLGLSNLVQLQTWLQNHQIGEHDTSKMTKVVANVLAKLENKCHDDVKCDTTKECNVFSPNPIEFIVSNQFLSRHLYDPISSDAFLIQLLRDAHDRDPVSFPVITLRDFCFDATVRRKQVQQKTCVHSVDARNDHVARSKTFRDHMTNCLGIQMTPCKQRELEQVAEKNGHGDTRLEKRYTWRVRLGDRFKQRLAWHHTIDKALKQQRYAANMRLGDLKVAVATSSHDLKQAGQEQVSALVPPLPLLIPGCRHTLCCRSDTIEPYKQFHVAEHHAAHCLGQKLDYMQAQADLLRSELPFGIADQALGFLTIAPAMYHAAPKYPPRQPIPASVCLKRPRDPDPSPIAAA